MKVSKKIYNKKKLFGLDEKLLIFIVNSKKVHEHNFSYTNQIPNKKLFYICQPLGEQGEKRYVTIENVFHFIMLMFYQLYKNMFDSLTFFIKINIIKYKESKSWYVFYFKFSN